MLLYTIEFGFWGMIMLAKACKGTGPAQSRGCWSTLRTRERKHLQDTPGRSAFVTPSVHGLAHLHGRHSSVLPRDLGLCLSAHCCVPCWALPLAGIWNTQPSFEGRGAGTSLQRSAVRCVVHCRCSPKGARKTQSHTCSSSGCSREVQFKTSTQANAPTSKDQVFQQCFTPAAPQDPFVSRYHLSRAPVGFLPWIACVVSAPSNTPENAVKEALEG